MAVVGISMGGAIAQELALRHPSLVRPLVLVSTWARCDGYLSEVFDHLRVAHEVLGPAQFAQLLQLRIWSSSYVSAHLQELQDARQGIGAVPVPDHAFAAQSAACISHDTLRRLSNIDAPTLVTAGREDCFTVLGHAEQVHSAIRGSQLEVFPGGHAHHWEHLEAFNDLTSAWLDERHSRASRVEKVEPGRDGRTVQRMMRIGCQTYSWQMSLSLYQGKIDHICEVVGQAGFSGLEPEVVMLGEFATAERLRGCARAQQPRAGRADFGRGLGR